MMLVDCYIEEHLCLLTSQVQLILVCSFVSILSHDKLRVVCSYFWVAIQEIVVCSCCKLPCRWLLCTLILESPYSWLLGALVFEFSCYWLLYALIFQLPSVDCCVSCFLFAISWLFFNCSLVCWSFHTWIQCCLSHSSHPCHHHHPPK
jgi:hypothetical protein